MSVGKYHLILIASLVALAMIAALSCTLGTTGFLSPILLTVDEHGQAIMQYRACRIALAIIAGSSLAASGASLQALFRNPLADPHIFGISAGAAFGAAIIIAFFSDQAIMPSAGAVVGGLVAFFVLFFYLQRSKTSSLNQCLLIGILINALATSFITVLKTILPMSKTQSLLFWLVGHINVIDTSSFLLIIPLWIAGMMGLFLIRAELEILSFGVDESRLLGINTDRIIKIAVVSNCLLIGNVVAYAGMIGFLGLVVPHLIRLLFNPNLIIVLPISAVVGAVLLVLFDMLSRLSFVIFDSEMPVGALCALFLSPIFFILLLRDQE